MKYTLDLLNNTLINGNFVNTGNALEPWGIAYDPSNGYIYVTNSGSGTVGIISTNVPTNSTSISSVTKPTTTSTSTSSTSTSAKPTPGVVSTWAVAAAAAVAVLIAAMLLIKRRKP